MPQLCVRLGSVHVWIVCTLVLIATSAGEDWPQWRGPNRDGVSAETGLIQSFDEESPRLVWQVRGLGSGYASVVVADGRIFTLGSRDGSEHLIALDAKNGSEIWSQRFGTGNHSNSAPTVDGDRVYGIGLKGDLICARAFTGEVLWQKNFKRDFGGKMMSGWGFSESPLIDGDWIVCTPGSSDAMLVAMDKYTGDEVWRCSVPPLGRRGRDGAGYSSVVVSHGAGVKQYVQLVGRGIIGVRASDGKFLWNYNRVANRTANIPTPIVMDDYVFCSSGYGTGAALIRLHKDSAEVRAEQVYFIPGRIFQNHHGGMIRIGDHVYAGTQHNNGFPTCLDWLTGKIVWGGKIRGPGSRSAAITYADGNFIFRYQDGVVALIGATPDGYHLKGSFRPAYQTDNSWAHPLVSDGRLYLREQQQLMCYDLRRQITND